MLKQSPNGYARLLCCKLFAAALALFMQSLLVVSLGLGAFHFLLCLSLGCLFLALGNRVFSFWLPARELPQFVQYDF